MPKLEHNIFLVVLFFVALVSCKKPQDNAQLPEPSYKNPTPYTLAIPSYFATRADTGDAPLTNEGVALGSMLFRDSSLSADGSVACITCHLPAKGFSDPRPVSLGVGKQAGTRNAMALANLAFQSHFFWDGRETNLEQLLIQPMTRPDEMALTPEQINLKLSQEPYPTLFAQAFLGQKPSFVLARRALSMYIRSLTSGNSKYDQYLLGKYTPSEQETRGLRLFFTHPDPRAGLRGGNCGDCHLSITTAGSTFGLTGLKNNGLKINNANDLGLFAITKAAADKGKFKIPTLRNIALTAPYMHDGRFATLEDVLNHYNDSTLFANPNVDMLVTAATNKANAKSLGLSKAEKEDIIAFMHMLTDTSALRR